MNNQIDLPYYLYLSRIKGLGPIKFNRILKDNKALEIDIKTFCKMMANGNAKGYSYLSEGIKKDIAKYDSYLYEEQQVIDNLNKESVFIITILDKRYPNYLRISLGLSAPPILYVKGNISLLKRKQIAIVGSRKHSKLGGEISSFASRIFTSYKFVITSGNADGIDKLAHYSCLEHGGSTIFVIGSGILQYLEELYLNALSKNILIISEFYPTAKCYKGYLMARNKTICGLSKAVLVVEAYANGGAFYTGSYSLMMNKPTFVVDYYKRDICYMGNKSLIDKGATSITYNNISQISNQLHSVIQGIVSLKKSIEQYEFFTGISDIIKWYFKNDRPFPVLSYDILNKL